LVDTKSHASEILKVTMSKLLGGVIFELVLILLNLDFEIDQSWIKMEKFLNDIHIPTGAKYFSTLQLLFVLTFVKGCVQLSFIFFQKWFSTHIIC
jgi:hypothetical protein